jgi:hypothetical protein
MTMNPFKIALIGLCLLTIMAQQVFGYQFKKTLKELATTAPLIIEGKVIKLDPRYVKFRDNEKFIKTFITLSVTSVLKGEYKNSSLTISMRGGEIGEHAMIGDFSFKFNVDEEVILFLNPIEDEMWEIFGISGKLSIQLKDNAKECDCSMLKSDERQQYGPKTFVKYNDIINRINEYLSKNGGD